MLNCTDLECVLHHRYYYTHLHHVQQQHQLPSGGQDNLSTASEDAGNELQYPENDTDSLQSLSHLDSPVDSGYIVCGVLISLFFVGIAIVLLAVTISKLRKREEHQTANIIDPEHQQQVLQPDGIVNLAGPDISSCCNPSSATLSIANGCGVIHHQQININGDANNCFTTSANGEQFIWQFPPPYAPPQYTIYNDQDTLVHGLASDRQSFAKGFRKNIGGRWRRFVKKKPESETCAIPPELKDQLKTIYVY